MTSTDDSIELLVVAAEASSTLYARRLLEHWQKKGVKVRAFGIGSRDMEEMGFEIIGRSEELSVVGLQEVIAHWSKIKNAFHGLLAAAEKRQPKVALLLDYPGFNLRLAKKLKKMGIKVVYYISPQVWAWRRGRVHLIKKIIDKMLVLFPFEVDFYRQYNVPVEFVGHPLLDELDDKYFSPPFVAQLRARYGWTDEDVVLTLMPGSRYSELKHHLVQQLRVAEKLAQQHPRLRVALLVAPTFTLEEIKQQLPPMDLSLVLVKDEPLNMISLADVVLCASGTATLMVGLLEKPMVIMYRMNAFTAWLAKLVVKETPFFGLINLVLGKLTVPELFQEQASDERLIEELSRFITSRETRKNVAVELRRAKDCLGSQGATSRVASQVEALC